MQEWAAHSHAAARPSEVRQSQQLAWTRPEVGIDALARMARPGCPRPSPAPAAAAAAAGAPAPPAAGGKALAPPSSSDTRSMHMGSACREGRVVSMSGMAARGWRRSRLVWCGGRHAPASLRALGWSAGGLPSDSSGTPMSPRAACKAAAAASRRPAASWRAEWRAACARAPAASRRSPSPPPIPPAAHVNAGMALAPAAAAADAARRRPPVAAVPAAAPAAPAASSAAPHSAVEHQAPPAPLLPAAAPSYAAAWVAQLHLRPVAACSAALLLLAPPLRAAAAQVPLHCASLAAAGG